MRSQESLRSGVALLAAAVLALAWSPAAAAPAGKIVNVNETLSTTAGYEVDNLCTGTQNITLQGKFSIQGNVTFYPNGTTDVDLVITPMLNGTDTAGVSYKSSRPMHVGFGRIPPRTPLTWSSPFEVIPQDGSPSFYLKVRFVINPKGNPNVDFVTFSKYDSTGAITIDGFDGVLCTH